MVWPLLAELDHLNTRVWWKFFILHQVYRFLRISRNCVRLDYSNYYARKMTHFALVTIDFLLDTERFLRPRRITVF